VNKRISAGRDPRHFLEIKPAEGYVLLLFTLQIKACGSWFGEWSDHLHCCSIDASEVSPE